MTQTGKLSTRIKEETTIKEVWPFAQDYQTFRCPNIYLAKDPSIVHALNDNRCCVKMLLICLCVCGTVSSMLSGLKTRSLGLNTLGTT